MTYLSRTAKLGIAAETTDPVYTAPSFTIPFDPPRTSFRDHIIQLRDTTSRGNDTWLQDVEQGPYWTDWTITTAGYADWAGWLLRAVIGPDVLTAGVVTTLAQGSAAGALSVTLAAAPPTGSVLMLGTGATLEYAQCGTPSGTGPYTVPITTPAAGLRFAHQPGEPAQSQATHTFHQNRLVAPSPWPSYSLTTDDGAEVLGWPGCILGSLRVQVQADGYVRLASTWAGFPPSAVATFTESESAVQPSAGWGWSAVTAGGASTRGQVLDLTLSRVLDVKPCCNGQQSPLVIATGPLKTDASYKAMFDTSADLSLYRAATQEPAVFTLAQPALQGGSSIAITMTRSGWTDGEADLKDAYVSADFKLSGIANITDSGVSQVTLTNFVNTPYGP